MITTGAALVPVSISTVLVLFRPRLWMKKGKKRRSYRLYRTPYDRLRFPPEAGKFLKSGITLAKLGEVAHQMSDNDFAKVLGEKERKLFEKIRKHNRKHGSHRKSKT